MQATGTSIPTRILRGDTGLPPAGPVALRPFGRVEPDPFVNFLGVHIPLPTLVRAGILSLD